MRKARNLPLKTHCGRGHEFTPENTYVLPKGGTWRACIACRNLYRKTNPPDPKKMRAHRAKWLAKNPTYEREEWLIRRYNITWEMREAMKKAQDGKCAICDEEMKKPHVDHDHDTGAVRGLLCTLCNTGIGSLRENESILFRAIEYLRKHKRPVLVSREVA